MSSTGLRIRGRAVLEHLSFEKEDLLPVTVVSAVNGEVLMQAYADRRAVKKTLETGRAWFYSRSRGRLWMKGESSGNVMEVLEVLVDCDGDSLIYVAVPQGPACHTGEWTCFHRLLPNGGEQALYRRMWELIREGMRRSRVYVRPGVGRSHYLYVVNMLTDNIPPPPPLLVSLMSKLILREFPPEDFDKVVVPEALGLPLGSTVAYLAGKPLAVVRKRWYPVEGVSVEYSSGYEAGTYHVYGVEEGERVLLVDDAVSTGGTLVATLKALREEGVEVVGTAVALSKPQYGWREALEGERLWRAVDLYVDEAGRIRLVEPRYGWVEEFEVPVTLGETRVGE